MMGAMMIDLFLSLALFAQDAPAASVEPEPVVTEVAAEAFDTDAALTSINAWLNSVETYRARFSQIAPDFSSTTGVLSIRRPGRLRFDYDDPSSLLVVADGTTVAIEDSDLETVDRVPLRSTPLWWILKPDVNLAEDARVTDIRLEDGYIYVTAEDRNEDMDGAATFLFNPDSYALEEWFVSDSLGYTTRVTLSDIETDVRLNPRLFVLDDAEDDRRNRRQ